MCDHRIYKYAANTFVSKQTHILLSEKDNKLPSAWIRATKYLNYPIVAYSELIYNSFSH